MGINLVVNEYEVPFYVKEAIDTLKEFLCIKEDTNSIIAKAKRLSNEGEEVNEEILEVLMDEVASSMPAVANALSTTDGQYIIDKAIIVMINSLSERELDKIEKLIDIDSMLGAVEDKLMIAFPINAASKLLKVVTGKFPSYDVTEIDVPEYTEAAISGLTAIERSIKAEYPKVNQNILNVILREIGAGIKEVDSFGEGVNEEEDIDEAPILKNKKAVRNGKVVTLKKRKKRMSAAQRRKISRAMKKVKKVIKPSTIRKMLKSRKIAQKRGL